MKDRFKELRKVLGMTQQEFADRLAVSRNNIAGYEVGKSAPSESVIRLVCKEFSVNEEWLRTGSGEMFVSQKTSMRVQAWIDRVLAGRPEDIRFRAVSLLADMPEEWWDILADRLAIEARKIYEEEQKRDIAAKVKSYQAELESAASSEKLPVLPTTSDEKEA